MAKRKTKKVLSVSEQKAVVEGLEEKEQKLRLKVIETVWPRDLFEQLDNFLEYDFVQPDDIEELSKPMRRVVNDLRKEFTARAKEYKTEIKTAERAHERAEKELAAAHEALITIEAREAGDQATP